MIKSGQIISEDVPNQYNPNSIVRYAYIQATTIVDEEPVTVRIDIRKSPEKNRFWVHKIDFFEKNNGVPNQTDMSDMGSNYSADYKIPQTVKNVKNSLKESAGTADGRNVLYALSNTKQIDEGDVPSTQNGRGSHTNRLSVTDSIRENEPIVKNSIKESDTIENRLSGDDLLNAYDTIEEIRNVGGRVDENGYAYVYHNTSKENADNIRKTGVMSAKEDGIFVSTKPDGQAAGYGNETVALMNLRRKLKAESLSLCMMVLAPFLDIWINR